jgi:hypothetical protein
MSLEVTRVYKDADGNPLRIDTMTMEARGTPLSMDKDKITYIRRLSTELIVSTGARTVSDIQLITTADIIDGSGFSFVRWTARNIYCGMSDLPGLGETV